MRKRLLISRGIGQVSLTFYEPFARLRAVFHNHNATPAAQKYRFLHLLFRSELLGRKVYKMAQGNMKRHMPELLAVLYKTITKKGEFHIWTPDELVHEINTNLGIYKLSNARALGRLLSSQRQFKLFKCSGAINHCTQYIFIRSTRTKQHTLRLLQK